MARTTAVYRFAALAVLIAAALSCCCRFPFRTEWEGLTLLSYNVQNLFDDVDNGGEYPEYDPGGGEWKTSLFHRRLLALSQTLRSNPQGGADILLLQEVENENTVEQLKEHYLRGGGYHYLAVTDVSDSPINLACLSRLPITGLRIHAVTVEGEPAGRPLMELEIDVGGTALYLLHCHWKSKSGGAEPTEVLRRAAAGVAARRVAELTGTEVEAEVLIAGDLNENADEWSRVGGAYPVALMPADPVSGAAAKEGGTAGNGTGFGALRLSGSEECWDEASGGERHPAQPLFFSPWLAGAMGGEGSYYYDGRWETIDHFLLNEAFFDGSNLEYASCSVVIGDRLLNEKGVPFRWITRTRKGCSDHLPLLLRLEKYQ
jgi:endonuclease/exonuclease/phosphatase family metal-dependent hydrolase